jgi:hypothetical protein
MATRLQMVMPNGVLFLDRDGAINVDCGYIHRSDQFNAGQFDFWKPCRWTRMIRMSAARHGSANSAPRPHRCGRTAYTQSHRLVI